MTDTVNTIDQKPMSAGLLSGVKNSELKFLFFNNLKYSTRKKLIIANLVVGAVIQLFPSCFVVGIMFIAAASGLSYLKALELKTNLPAFHNESWEQSDISLISKIIEIYDRQYKWNEQGSLDATNVQGGLIFVILLIVTGTIFYFGYFFIAMNVAILILPQWFSGKRVPEQNTDLYKKARYLSRVLESYKKGNKINGKFGLQLLITEGEQKIPTNMKFTYLPDDSPSYFYGIQTQVVLNHVKYDSYPYCYSVVICKENNNLIQCLEKIQLDVPGYILVEPMTKENVEVVVFRQDAEIENGYETNVDTGVELFELAVKFSEKFLEEQKAMGS